MLRFFFVLLFAIGSAQAAHITDKLLVGLYAKPDTASQPTKVLPSGTPLDVQKKNGAFSKVRLGDGKEGWVKTIYISNEKPARAMLLELQAKSSTLQKKLRQKEKALKAALAGQTPATGDTDKLKRDLALAKQKLATMSNTLKKEQKETKRLNARLKKTSSTNSGSQSKQIRAIKKKLASSEAELRATLHEARLLQDLLKKTDQTASQRISTLEQELQQAKKKLQETGGSSNSNQSTLIKQNAIMKQRLQQMGEILGAPLPEVEKDSDSGSGFGFNTWSILVAILLVVGLIGGVAYKSLHMRRRYGGFRI
ncbi:MAG: TIGR04211 family SH3 domain-containing protein [Gammaproteobacteria bacterium]|nr:TIGR04211 family SH3 domain-containing protein [Gammaproteobacteria bacterium]